MTRTALNAALAAVTGSVKNIRPGFRGGFVITTTPTLTGDATDATRMAGNVTSALRAAGVEFAAEDLGHVFSGSRMITVN